MRTEINKQAWEILLEDEKLAVSLKVGYNKSTWEAGEVMSKAHYKFLEIEARARHFIKLFTEHFEVYHELIPEFIPLDKRVREYFINVIQHRLTIGEAVSKIDDYEFKVRSKREEIIIKNLEKLVKDKKVTSNNIALLVFDFDRWNNYRILPLSIQEPSAFKRRNKKNDQRNIKNLISINEWSIHKIIERYKFEHSHPSTKYLYLPIPSEHLDEEEAIVSIKYSQSNIEELSKVGFFLFSRKQRAQEFYDLIKGYDFFNPKGCKEGQKFWPLYRQITKNSVNYNAISKRIASRKFLEMALRDMDLNILNPKHSDPNSPKKKRRKNKELGI